ncbi:hypothetical protein [Bradyrhizobium sp. Cp5.3]|uniref:hypothetical protein n=1 Tax=Bradyrhizobium sp. Cp5.3 TaxID=443598 RepID=UPI0004023D36|nr:hypothetical protein [Bradyrhizobium sp. Cp5.3]
MRIQLSSNNADAKRSAPRRFTLMCLGATLAAGAVWLAATAAIAQTTVPTMPMTQPPVGMGATSPLNPQALRPEGIPLGSTEIATPGVSPISPAQGMANCATSSNAGAPGALFDGGGLAGGSSVPCTGSATSPSALPSASTVGRVGIPLGATELGGAGLSPTVPVPGPDLSGGPAPMNSTGNP